jgi:hypothetical protein
MLLFSLRSISQKFAKVPQEFEGIIEGKREKEYLDCSYE